MSYEHNFMAHRVSAQLLAELRSSAAPWAGGCLTSKSTLWQGVADWPRPDIAFQDRSNSASVAIEFKPPNQPKREYITGLGQALTYLNDFKYAGLILPNVANDGFPIAEYLANTHAALLSQTSLAILAYDKDPATLTILRALMTRSGGPTSIPKGIGGKVFWGYWRDLSNHDLLTMLRLIDAGVPNFNAAFTKFWIRYLVKGRAQTWEDNFRKKKQPTAYGKTGEGLNIQLAIRHAGWVDSLGRLTGGRTRIATDRESIWCG
jgi:hypothetical protein